MSVICEYIPSPQQQAFFEFVDTGRGSAVVEAVAGAGKTTTMIQGIKRMRGSVQAVMFNKDAAADFKIKVAKAGLAGRDKLFIKTCHGVGYSAWTRFEPKCDLVETKTHQIIDEFVQSNHTSLEDAQLLETGRNYLVRIISLAKDYLFGIRVRPTQDKWAQMDDRFGLSSELADDVDLEALNTWATTIFEKSGRLCKSEGDRRGIIDFADMIWAPLAYNCHFFKADNVILDEAQDTNPSRRELVKRIMGPRSRLYAVGDRHQAIYAFTGANSDSMDIIKREFNCAELGLTITYRCPKAVVGYAQQWVSHIQAADTAPEGEVRNVILDPKKGDTKPRPWFKSDAPAAEDAILCRYNKPLVSTAFALIKSGVACKMQGRDIGKGLVALATKWKSRTLDQLEQRLEKFRNKEVTKARAKRSETMEQAVNDRVDCILVFVSWCREKGNNTVECVVAEINNLFSDEITGMLTLASGHRAKGREWKRVYWLQTTPPARELKDWEAEAERNLNYVIATRAMETLILIPEGTP